jgi:acyl-CoA synthetase (NDP forming)
LSQELFDQIFHPATVAIVGASSNDPETGWVGRLVNFGYRGRIYPVNPKVSEIGMLKCYPTVRDIPEPVDLAIFNIPARLTPQIMQDCVARGVRIAHIFTAGFSETGKEEASKLEAHVAEIARVGNIRVIGPNCMGVYYPAGGLTFLHTFAREVGTVSMVTQSGAGAARFIHLANDRHIYFSKVVSYGNAVDLDAPDFLEYLAEDSETAVITCYIEGARDCRRFMASVMKCLQCKPVIILKAGLTESGAHAAASHTASLAGSAMVWDGFFRQTGAIRVDCLEEMADVVMAFLKMKSPGGRRVGIVGRGGGIGVIATDVCERAGLKVPPFLPETQKQLEAVTPEAGITVRNPVESAREIAGAADFYKRGLKIVDTDPQVDCIIIHIAVDIYGGRQQDMQGELLKAAEALAVTAAALTKPLAVVLSAGEHLETFSATHQSRELLLKAGIPVYASIEAAARAIYKFRSARGIGKNP